MDGAQSRVNFLMRSYMYSTRKHKMLQSINSSKNNWTYHFFIKIIPVVPNPNFNLQVHGSRVSTPSAATDSWRKESYWHNLGFCISSGVAIHCRFGDERCWYSVPRIFPRKRAERWRLYHFDLPSAVCCPVIHHWTLVYKVEERCNWLFTLFINSTARPTVCQSVNPSIPLFFLPSSVLSSSLPEKPENLWRSARENAHSETWLETTSPRVLVPRVRFSRARLPPRVHLLNAHLTSTFCSDRIGRDLRKDKGSYSNDTLQRDQEKEAHKVMKILTVVVIVFALLMLPNHIYFLWYDFGKGGKCRKQNMF